MKATIDRENCIGCELCVVTCPSVFRMAKDGHAEVYTAPVPKEDEIAASEAAEHCLASVITVE